MSLRRPHADLEYERLGNSGVIVVLYVGLLSVLYKQRTKKESGPDKAPIPFLAGRADFFEAAAGLDRYLSAAYRKPKQIRVNAAKTPAILNRSPFPISGPDLLFDFRRRL
jgi:hypothetical protein